MGIETKLKVTDCIPIIGTYNYHQRTKDVKYYLLTNGKISGKDYIKTMEQVLENRFITGAISLVPLVGTAAYLIAKYTVN